MLLGIDSGQTVLKAVVYSTEGVALGQARTSTALLSPQPHFVERDMTVLGQQLMLVIQQALNSAGVSGDQITGIGVAGHGDGLYPVRADGTPARNAIVALDTRAQPLIERWAADGTSARAREITGQPAVSGSLAPLVSWLATNELDALTQTRWLLYCKDWLVFQLTGSIGTDVVEASSSVGMVDGSGYSLDAMEAYGIAAWSELLPPPSRPSDVAGYVTETVAAATGLAAGTPVVRGTHDVVAGALGTGCVSVGQKSVVVGTYGVNQLLTTDRHVNDQYQTRPWIEPGLWVSMGASPASATNLDWFISNLMAGCSEPIVVANAEIEAVLDDPSEVFFHPYIYGSPFGGHASASFLGVRSWHTRGHLLKALFEGVVMNHRFHLDAYDGLQQEQVIRLSGGGAQSRTWCTMFADGLNSTIEVTESDESGTLGAAMLAGIGTGIYRDAADAARRCVRIRSTFQPQARGVGLAEQRYEVFIKTLNALRPLWDAFTAAQQQQTTTRYETAS